MTALTWDDLPGESATAIADAEQELDSLIRSLDNEDATLELSDVADYLTNVRDYAQGALDDIAKKESA